MQAVAGKKKGGGNGARGRATRTASASKAIISYFGRCTADERVAAFFLYRLAFADSMVCQDLAGVLANQFEAEFAGKGSNADGQASEDVVYLAGVLAGLNLADD